MVTAVAPSTTPAPLTAIDGTDLEVVLPEDMPQHGTAWRAQALCHTNPTLGAKFLDPAFDFDPNNPVDPDTWDPMDAATAKKWADRKAAAAADCKAVCAQCPVMQACRTASLTEDTYGVAGGWDDGDREQARTKLQVTVQVNHMPGPCHERGPHNQVDDVEVVRLVRLGLTRAAVAEKIGCSERTVERSRERHENGDAVDLSVSTRDYSPKKKKKTTTRAQAGQPRNVHDKVVLPPKSVLNKPVETGSVLSSTSSLLDYTALIYTVLADAYQARTNNGWVCFETILSRVIRSGLVSDDVAFAEFARTNSTTENVQVTLDDGSVETRKIKMLTVNAAATDHDRRITMGVRAVVSNILYCASRTKRAKDQPVPAKVEKYMDDRGEQNAPWYRLTELAAGSWQQAMSNGETPVWKQRVVSGQTQEQWCRLGKEPKVGHQAADEDNNLTVEVADDAACSSAA